MTNIRDFSVPKEKHPVTVHLLGGGTHPGSIFLELSPDALTLHQKIAAFLEDKAEFFPLSLNGDGPHFLSKRSVRIVEVDYSGDDQEFSLMHSEEVSVEFSDGSTVTGSFMADVPEEKARLSDSLNLPTRYLSVRREGAILFLNKETIRKVVYTSGA